MPKLYCPDLDTLAGNMLLRRAGVTQLDLDATRATFGQHVQIASAHGIRDAGGYMVLGADDSGHLSTLGRIDCAVKYADEANVINIQPAMALLSGGTAQPDGTVDSVASETLIFSLSGLYPYLMGGQLARVAKFRIDIVTPNNTTYVTSCEVFRIERDNPVEYSQQAYPADIGNGTSGHAHAENTITAPFSQGEHTHLKVVTVRTAGTLTITQIRLYLDMDT